MKPEDCAGYPDTRGPGAPYLQVAVVAGTLHTVLEQSSPEGHLVPQEPQLFPSVRRLASHPLPTLPSQSP